MVSIGEEILALVLVRILQVLAIGCVFAAVVFLVWPKPWLQKVNASLNKWFSTKGLADKLDLAVNMDDRLLKSRKFLGLVAIVLAVILLYLTFTY